MLEQPEQEEGNGLHAHDADEVAAEASIIGRVVWGLGHAPIYGEAGGTGITGGLAVVGAAIGALVQHERNKHGK